MKHTILCVDDEIDNVDALERLFRKKYNVLKAISAAEGLAKIKAQKDGRVALIISDQRMPQKTGVEFLKESIEYVPEAIRILLTGYTDIESVIDAINSGEVYRYITKPWDPVDLANTVDKAIERYDLSAELKIKNFELRKALDELKVLDEAKNKFMILINHELKTPLTVILSFIELLRETPLTPEQKKYLSRIVQGSEKLKKLVEDTLIFVSAEAGTLKVDKRKVDLVSASERVEKLLQAQLEEKEQKLVIEGQGCAKTDAQHVQEVILRLVENASRFGKAESEIQVQVEELEDELRFSVHNSGKPISKKVIAGLNSAFNIDEDIMKHSEGLGLGLSLSQALLKTLGSQLEITTGKDWTEVSFRLSVR